MTTASWMSFSVMSNPFVVQYGKKTQLQNLGFWDSTCGLWVQTHIQAECVACLFSPHGDWLMAASSPKRRWLPVQITYVCFTYMQSLRWLTLNRNCFFHQYGAILHLSLVIWEFLCKIFGGRWTGQDGKISWPSNSYGCFLLRLHKGKSLSHEICYSEWTPCADQRCSCFYNAPDAWEQLAWNRLLLGHFAG